jgi:peptide/nickel transport system substrate-binding protein
MFRRLLPTLVAVSALLASVAGGGIASAQGNYNQSNTVISAQDISDAVTLDPGVAYEFSSVAADLQMYTTLVRFPPGNLNHVSPSLATSWTDSNAGRDWVFHLRKGVKFSNGDPVTAQDVVYSLERVVNIPNDPASWLITQTGLTPQNFAKSIQAVGNYEVKMTLPQPFAPGAWLAILANTVAGVVDQKVVEQHVVNGDWGTHWLYNHSAGSGPYVLQNWTPSQQMAFTANPNYSLGPKPQVQRLVWQMEADTTARLDMLLRGDADLAIGLTSAQIKSLQGNPNIKILKAPEIAEVYLGMGVKQVPALGNPLVREAVKYAIDYNSIIKDLLQGNGIELQGIIPKGIFGYVNKLPYTYNLAKAKQLMAKAGYAKGFSATMLVPNSTFDGGVSGPELGLAVAGDLARIGIKISIRQLQSSELYSEYRAHKAQFILAEWSLDYPDPQDFAAPFADYTQKSLIWRLQDDNVQLAKLVEKSATMDDTPQRQALYNQINADLVTGPFAVLFQPDEVIAYSKKLHNLTYDSANNIPWVNVVKH